MVALSLILGNFYNTNWYLRELSRVGIDDYALKRARLRDHMSKVVRIYQYGKARMELIEDQEEGDQLREEMIA